MDIAISSWSLHREFQEKRIKLLEFPKICRRRFAIKTVELNQPLFSLSDREYIQKIKDSLRGMKVVNICLGFSALSASEDEGELKKIESWIKIAKHLNSPSIRVNTGGDEVTEKAIQQVVQGYQKILFLAEKEKIKVLIENHGGISKEAKTILQIVKEVNNPLFGTCPDIGNFPPNSLYQELRQIAPFMSIGHIKSYEFDEEGEETTMDIRRCIDIFRKAGFDGFLSIEFEGKGNEYEGIENSLELIKSCI